MKRIVSVLSTVIVLSGLIPCPVALGQDRIYFPIVDTLHGECLDHMLILNPRHLDRVTEEFIEYYNSARPHHGLNQRIPIPPNDQSTSRHVFKMPVRGGLHHDYRRAS